MPAAGAANTGEGRQRAAAQTEHSRNAWVDGATDACTNSQDAGQCCNAAFLADMFCKCGRPLAL